MEPFHLTLKSYHRQNPQLPLPEAPRFNHLGAFRYVRLLTEYNLVAKPTAETVAEDNDEAEAASDAEGADME